MGGTNGPKETTGVTSLRYAAKSGLGVPDSRDEFMLPGVRFEPEERAYREP